MAQPRREDYLQLASYFVEGFMSYSTKDGTGAIYPGLRSNFTPATQNLEGFSRIAPLLAVLLSESSTDTLTLPSGRRVDVAKLLKNALKNGSNPASTEYWGDIHDLDQKIVEAADIALALWITKARVWAAMTSVEQHNIAAWLNGANGKDVADNNWHLFIAQIDIVLGALGQPLDRDEINWQLNRVRSFYAGDGWFRDGPNGLYDYYNAWAFQYQLDWMNRIRPDLVGDLVSESLPKFSWQLLHLIGPRGFPVFGRSVCYRLAITAPLLFAAEFQLKGVPPAEAKRALDLTWRFFVTRGAVTQGRVTQGYCNDDATVLDSYSGPASCLWSLRSLIVALSLPANSPVWAEAPGMLPVEQGDFTIPLGPTNLIAVGDHASGDVVIHAANQRSANEPKLVPYTFRERALDALFGGSRRPDNELAKYHRSSYSSANPFCGCTR